MTTTADPIALEEARTDDIRRQADRANEARDDARRALVQAKLDGLDEVQQRPLLDRFVALQADADAASAAVTQHEQDLASMRSDVAARLRQAEVEALEASPRDARQDYLAAFQKLEPAARAAQEALDRMAQARSADDNAARRMARLQGADPKNGFAYVDWTRLPRLRNEYFDPFPPNVDWFIQAYRPRT